MRAEEKGPRRSAALVFPIRRFYFDRLRSGALARCRVAVDLLAGFRVSLSSLVLTVPLERLWRSLRNRACIALPREQDSSSSQVIASGCSRGNTGRKRQRR